MGVRRTACTNRQRLGGNHTQRLSSTKGFEGTRGRNIQFDKGLENSHAENINHILVQPIDKTEQRGQLLRDGYGNICSITNSGTRQRGTRNSTN